eukprot:9489511-Pyramimonas_sp.AAC.1
MGHSALNWLLHSAPNATYYGFDAGEMFHRYPLENSKLINGLYSKAGQTPPLNMFWGDSTKTLSTFASQKKADNPDFVCDLIHVDGGHFDDVPEADITNMCKLADPGNSLIIIDDVNCIGWAATNEKSGCRIPELAWREKRLAGTIEQKGCYRFQDGNRGFCYGVCKEPLEEFDVPKSSALTSVNGISTVREDDACEKGKANEKRKQAVAASGWRERLGRSGRATRAARG